MQCVSWKWQGASMIAPTKSPAVGLTDEGILAAARPHFKHDANITPKSLAGYVASVRAVLAVAMPGYVAMQGAAASNEMRLLNEIALMWHADGIAAATTGEATTTFAFDDLMLRVEKVLFDARAALAQPAAAPGSESIADKLNKLDRMLANCRITAKHPTRQYLYALLSEVCAQPAAAPSDCHHDDTVRQGAIWTACQQCGKRWADDEAKPAAAQDKVDGWVSVDERLPEVDEDGIAHVWAWCVGCPGFIHTGDARVTRYHSSLGWQPQGATSWDWIVTYWHPLPAAPTTLASKGGAA
jgi:hypothetical protein